MQNDEGFADVNGTRLYYEVAGSGHPLVLIHGFSLDTRMWDDQVEVLAPHYQVVRYDLRGFGQSARPTTEPYSHPDDLCALMLHLGLDHAFILGLSLGGAVAVDFAVTYPEMTDALIPVDAALIGGYEWVEGRPSAGMRRQAQHAGLESAKAVWLHHPLFAPAREQPKVSARLKRIVDDYSGWHFINDDPARVLDPPAIDRLNTLTMPTLVILGERDLRDFHRIADILTAQIVGARKVVIADVGHMSNMEHPEVFNDIVLGFLADLQDCRER
jgi:pimeloyl-ACP methyl ester carboxylesterase